MNRSLPEANPHWANHLFRINGWVVVLAGCLVAGSVISSFAGYNIETQVETAGGTNRYTWTIQNELLSPDALRAAAAGGLT
jgi:hypothetical protein